MLQVETLNIHYFSRHNTVLGNINRNYIKTYNNGSCKIDANF